MKFLHLPLPSGAPNMPILSCQAVPVFCDIDPFTGCADPEDIERRISSRTKALIIVHYKGVPANMDAVLKLTKRHGISLVEDCFRVYGAAYKGEKQALLVILVASACN